jgi:hypothetical protein
MAIQTHCRFAFVPTKESIKKSGRRTILDLLNAQHIWFFDNEKYLSPRLFDALLIAQGERPTQVAQLLGVARSTLYAAL